MSTVLQNQRRVVACLLFVSFIGSVLLSPYPIQAQENESMAASQRASSTLRSESHETETAAVEKPADAAAQAKKKHFPWLGAILSLALVGGLAYYFLFLKTTLQVTTDPPGAMIYLDGKDSGYTSPCLLKLAVGSHTIKAALDGYADMELEVIVKNGKNSVAIPLDIGTFFLTAPGPSANVQRESACLISWDSTALAAATVPSTARKAQSVLKVDFDLYQNGTKVSNIAQAVPNSGTYTWNVSAAANEGHNFNILVSCSAAPATRAFGPAFNLLGFKEDFTDNKADFWLPDPASAWTAAGGHYTAANAGNGFSVAIYDYFYGESAFSVESRMRWSEYSGGQGGEPLFIMLSTSNSVSNNSGYVFEYSKEGAVRISRIENVNFQSSQSAALTSLYSAVSSAVNPGLLNWNTIKVVRNGSSYALSINGVPVHTVNDNTFNPTHIVIGFSGSGARTVCNFDYVHMTVDPEKQ